MTPIPSPSLSPPNNVRKSPTSSRQFLFACIALVCFSPDLSRAQLSVAGGNQTLSITTAVPGSQPTSVVNTACTLNYQKQSAISRITVSTSCPGQKFGLSVVATSVTLGVAAPQVTLLNGGPAMNLITNIPKTGAKNGSCILQFTASATFSQGTSADFGDDVHAITYTILAP